MYLVIWSPELVLKDWTQFSKNKHASYENTISEQYFARSVFLFLYIFDLNRKILFQAYFCFMPKFTSVVGSLKPT